MYEGKTVLLVDKTIEKFKYNPLELSRGSHKRVYVKCNTCEEVFLKEFKVINNLHNCPKFRNINNTDCKWCNSCNKYLPFDNFHNSKNRTYGIDAYCKTCINEGPKSRKNNLNKWIRYINSIKKSKGNKKDVPYDLNFEFLLNLWGEQNGRCYYSNVLLTFGRRQLNSASLERLDPTRGYIKSNVVWVAKAMNYMKNNASYDDFVKFLEQINISRHIMPRCEYKAINNKAKIPERSKGSDAGLDISSVEDVNIEPNKILDISTGIILSAPTGHYFTVEGRSGLFRKGIFPVRGIIDASYTGELKIALFNTSNNTYHVKCGDRIAQILVHKIYTPDIVIVDNFSLEHRLRGEQGYGSTGR